MQTPYLVGKGPQHVIVVHGWFGSAHAWEAFARVADTQRFTYAFMDCRGYGARRDAPGPYTMEAVAQDILQLADQLHWDQFDLVGHSMGGKAIQQVLRLAPQRVRSLVAVTPVPASGVPFDDATWSLFESAASSPDARAAIINFSTGQRLSSHWVHQTAQHSLDNTSQSAFGAYLHSWAREDLSDGLLGLKQPTLVITGEHDPGLTAEVMQATYLSLYPNARLHTLANSGHYPMDETPVALATVIEEFLSTQA